MEIAALTDLQVKRLYIDPARRAAKSAKKDGAPEPDGERKRRLKRATLRAVAGQDDESVPLPSREAYIAFALRSIGGDESHWAAEYDRQTGGE